MGLVGGDWTGVMVHYGKLCQVQFEARSRISRESMKSVNGATNAESVGSQVPPLLSQVRLIWQ